MQTHIVSVNMSYNSVATMLLCAILCNQCGRFTKLSENCASIRGRPEVVFATTTGLSLTSIQNYERDRVPQLRQMLIFLTEAEKAGRGDLAEAIRAHIQAEHGWDESLSGSFVDVVPYKVSSKLRLSPTCSDASAGRPQGGRKRSARRARPFAPERSYT